MTNDPSIPNSAKGDQIIAAWRDSIPPTLWSIYCGFIHAGFNAEQSLDLTKFIWIQITLKSDKNKPLEDL